MRKCVLRLLVTDEVQARVNSIVHSQLVPVVIPYFN